MTQLRTGKSRSPIIQHRNIVRGMASQIRRKGRQDSLDDNAKNYRLMFRRALAAARVEVPASEFSTFFARFKRQTSIDDNIARGVPIGSHFMNGMIEVPRLSLVHEIAWAAARISAYSDDINNFLAGSSDLDKQIWQGEFPKAIQSLEAIEREFGTSMWQLSLRIALEQQCHGIEAQKLYVTSLQAAHKGGTISYAAHFFSIRNEPTVTWSWYVDDTKRRIDQSRLISGIKDYFKFHFLRSWPSTNAAIVNILRYEQGHSIIDIYETFLSLAQHTASAQEDPSVVREMRDAIATLTNIRDPRLRKLQLYLGVCEDQQKFQPDIASAILLRGRPALSYRHAIRRLQASPTASDQGLVAAFARSVQPQRGNTDFRVLPPLWAAAMADLVRVFERGTDHQGSIDALHKLSANFDATGPAKALAGIVSSEASTEMLRPLSALRLIALNIADTTFCDVRAGLDAIHYGDLTGTYFAATFGREQVPTDIEPLAAHFAEAIAAARTQDWVTTASSAAQVQASRHEGLRRRARLLEIKARVRLDEVDPVVSAIGQEVAACGIAASLLPHVEILDGKAWSELRASAGRIGLPIALDLALKASGNDKIATHRRFAYDAYLHAQGVERASELAVEKCDSRALTYFLSEIAVPSVLDMSEALESTRDIQEERRKILSILSTLDPDNASEYEDEILDITDQLALAEGMKLVDSSRIHVDTDAIETWAKRELSDGYRRYRNLLNSGIGVADDFDLVLAAIKKSEDKSKSVFSVPANEADDLLISIIQQLLERFLLDSAHGLDSYLSRRIRHGSIVGFLRGPVEESRLVSLRDENDATYAPNIFWLDQLSDLPDVGRDLIAEFLENFARSYDDHLIRLRDELIQLKDKDHPNGLIDMRLYSDIYYLVRSAIKQSDSLSSFVQSCFASFWGLLDRYLTACRYEIGVNLRAALGASFDQLRGSVNQVYDDAVSNTTVGPPEYRRGIGELTAAITAAQTALQAALEDVQTWFARSDVKLASRIYTLEEALNVAFSSALARLRSYTPDISVECDDDIGVPAEDLSTIAEIILVTLTNACEHSGSDGNTSVLTRVHYDSETSCLEFSVLNPVAPHQRTELYVTRVATIREEIESGSATAAVRKDRRSGLRKLGALKRRFAVSDLSFGFTQADEFEVRMAVPFKITRAAAS